MIIGTSNEVDHSGLKLNFQRDCKGHLIIRPTKLNSSEGEISYSDEDSLDDFPRAKMTDTTKETTLNFNGPENDEYETIVKAFNIVDHTYADNNDIDFQKPGDVMSPKSDPVNDEQVSSTGKDENSNGSAHSPSTKENGDINEDSKEDLEEKKSENTSDAEKSSDNEEDSKGGGDDDEMQSSEPEINQSRDEAENKPMISVRRIADLMKNKVSEAQIEACSVCCDKFSTPAELEQHRASAGHYSCQSSDECSKMVFSSSTELSQHQTVHHQPPVQQLAQQVQRIPASFNSSQYRSPSSSPQQQQQQRNVYMTPPPMAQSYQSWHSQQTGTTQQIGSGVVLSTVSAPSPVPNLPPGIQLSKRPAPTQQEAPPPKQQRQEDLQESRPNIRLPDSITLVSRTPVQPTPQQRRTNSVTDMLANRGITVVPSGRPSNPQTSTTLSTSQIPRSLMNTSAISITPSSQQHSRQQSNFAVPAPKAVSRLLTVDLTKESDVPPRRTLGRTGRMRGMSSGRSICQICDKAFPTPQELSQHMACHRGGSTTNKLAYECRECTAQYPSEAGLQAHRQKYHGAGGPSPDMAIPVVDLKQVGVLSRLAALGIRSVIPLSQLHSGTGSGLFGLPVVAVDSASNPAICNIGGLGASNLLPLGPLKNIMFNNNNMR